MNLNQFRNYLNDIDFNQNIKDLISKTKINIPINQVDNIYERFMLWKARGSVQTIKYKYKDED